MESLAAEGNTHEDIGRKLGVSSSAVIGKLHRVKKAKALEKRSASETPEESPPTSAASSATPSPPPAREKPLPEGTLKLASLASLEQEIPKLTTKIAPPELYRDGKRITTVCMGLTPNGESCPNEILPTAEFCRTCRQYQ